MGRTTSWAAVVGAAALLIGTGCSTVVGVGGVGRLPTTAAPAVSVDATTATTSTTDPAPSATADAPPVVDTSGGDVTVATGEAATVLGTLQVREQEPGGYDRDLFGQRWSDDVSVGGGHNGCDTRNDILRRDLASVTAKPGTRDCVIAGGTLLDPYTGEIIDFVRGPDSDKVQIDHVVALSDAWTKGARWLTLEQRTDFANDPLNLLAVDGPTNQSKSDSDAARWLPPDTAAHCAYVARQIAVKDRYELWVTPTEFDAMTQVLLTCPGEPLPTG